MRNPHDGQEVQGREGVTPVREDRPIVSQSEKLVVTSTGPSSHDQVDPRFGRCAFFMILDGPEREFRPVENSARALGNGAGIQAAQALASMGVAVVLTGDLGPNAFRVLRAAGIRAFRTHGGTVQQAAADYFERRLTEIEGPTGPGHHGRRGFGPRWQ
ncbi:MAG: NifB/NifX family molybdenum-iron cluster-binding protein [Thermoplasmata archaeon]